MRKLMRTWEIIARVQRFELLAGGLVTSPGYTVADSTPSARNIIGMKESIKR